MAPGTSLRASPTLSPNKVIKKEDLHFLNHCHPRHVKREGPLGRGREAAVQEVKVFLFLNYFVEKAKRQKLW